MDSDVNLQRAISRVLNSQTNIQILQLLSSTKLYTREIAKILGKNETEISRRINLLKKLGLIDCKWEHIGDKNVKLCYSLVKKISFIFTGDKVRIAIEFHKRSIEIESTTEIYSNNIPIPQIFIGRRDYLEKLEKTSKPVIAVWGLPGIGKTFLVAKHVLGQGKPVFWYNITAFSSLRHFLWKISSFLNTIGYTLLLNMMRENSSPETILDVLVNTLNDTSIIVVIDDYQKLNDKELITAINMLAEQITRSRIFIISREKPRGLPYFKNRVEEIKVEGLGFNEFIEFVNKKGAKLSEHELVELYIATQGIPALLTLFFELEEIYKNKALDLFRRENVLSFVLNEIYNSLSNAEKHIVDILALIDKPLDLEVLRHITRLRNIDEILNSLAKRGIIEVYSGFKYSIHDIMRILVSRISEEKKKWIYNKMADYHFNIKTHEDLLNSLYYYYKAGNTKGIIKVLQRRIFHDLPYHTGYMDKYVELLEKILEENRESSYLTILLYYELGHLEAIRGYFEKAIEILKRAENHIREPVNDHERYLMALIYTSLAEAYSNIGENTIAYDYIKKLNRIINKIEDPDLDRFAKFHYYGTLGLYYYNLNECRRALDYYTERLKISKDIDEPVHYMTTLLGIATLYGCLKDYKKALEILEDCIDYLSKTSFTYIEALARMVAAEDYLNIGEYEKALSQINKALEVMERFKMRIKIAEASLVKAFIQHKIGDYKGSLENARRAYSVFKDINYCTKIIALLLIILSSKKLSIDAKEYLKELDNNKDLVEECSREDDYVKDLLKNFN